jgi:hypothetical protein
VLVAEFKRLVLVPRKNQLDDAGAAQSSEAGGRAGGRPAEPMQGAESNVE